MALLREAQQAPGHLGARADVHRAVPRLLHARGHAHHRHHSLEGLHDLAAGLRYHRGQLLPLLELLLSGAVPGQVYADHVRPGDWRGIPIDIVAFGCSLTYCWNVRCWI